MSGALGVLAIVLIGVLTWQGWRAGLLRRVLELAGMVISFFFATAHAAGLGAALTGWTHCQGRARLYAGWIVLFLIGIVVTRIVAGLASRAVQVSLIGWIDRLGGAVCGFLFGVLLASILLQLAWRLPGGEARHVALQANPVTRPILAMAPAISRPFRNLGEAPDRAWHGVRDGARRAVEAVDERLRPVRPDTSAALPPPGPGR